MDEQKQISIEEKVRIEGEECLEKWEDAYDFECITQSYRPTLAILLENQGVMNQIATNDEFIDASLPLVYRIYSTLMRRKLVGIQPMLGPESEAFFLKFVNGESDGSGKSQGSLMVDSQKIVAKTRTLKTYINQNKDIDIDELGTAIADEITREIVTDLRFNAGTVANFEWENGTRQEEFEQLYVKLVEVGNTIHRKTMLGSPTWVYTSPEIAGVFTAASTNCFVGGKSNPNKLGISYQGTVMNRWRLHVDPLFPTNQILLGYCGENARDAGYQYCPYVPLSATTIYDSVGSYPKSILNTRYAKKLLTSGSKFYSRVTVSGFDKKSEFSKMTEKILEKFEREQNDKNV